ncbi:hypothetical protein BN1221_02714c [Brenneria goodwinii]|uniref:Uncharacterized protein n=1 Tax=Brenneria goodwinii TaxID=1109412 RepID=A0A0G4JX42_9GAMM|nr:hypothetical protein BN1221_02714c [Brenneria goodwinii]
MQCSGSPKQREAHNVTIVRIADNNQKKPGSRPELWVEL